LSGAGGAPRRSLPRLIQPDITAEVGACVNAAPSQSSHNVSNYYYHSVPDLPKVVFDQIIAKLTPNVAKSYCRPNAKPGLPAAVPAQQWPETYHVLPPLPGQAPLTGRIAILVIGVLQGHLIAVIVTRAAWKHRWF